MPKMLSGIQYLFRSGASRKESVGSGSRIVFPRHRHTGSANTLVLLICFVFGGALLAALGMRFPEEASRWIENQQQIREFQELNADLRKRQEEREERLKNTEENYMEQELEIRRLFNLHKPGDKVFILPPGKPESKDAAPALPPVPTPATP
ncbi:MAG: hypothetical protein KIT83_17780 [Bryobacterales bacterium]|nr:hypothetical protein [Bryobacterales bacterium]